ncbi:MAG: PrsW family intramembrane metalloprotease [Planctomycetes bacterium]|nr:PrsW family intramembrane metalloprotease [Planctomycetota bacterium]
MATWSVPVNPGPQGWKLRVLSGTSLGKEFDLPLSRYVLGSQPPSNIVIPDPSIAPEHIIIEIEKDHIKITDCSGHGVLVNDVRVHTAQVVPGDHVTVGKFKFEFSNPNYVAKTPLVHPGGLLHMLTTLSLTWRVGLILFAVAATLFILLATTKNPNLVPVTLLAMSAVVPATMICWLVERYDETGISFHTLAITFLAGGSIGIIAAMINFTLANWIGGQFLLLPIFAGLYEEPAKFLATIWRWRHPRYDRPMDGLILGTVSGLGFAVAETAGYGFGPAILGFMEPGIVNQPTGFSFLLILMLERGLASPFGHGMWTGIVTAAFWQNGRDLGRAFRTRSFLIAAAWAIGLHALWNSAALCFLGWFLVIVSASLSAWQYRLLLVAKGYRP